MFYLDEDLSHKIAEILRELEWDAISSHECGRNGFDDEEQLRFAAQENRIMVTCNRDDFIRLTVQFFENKEPHCGLLIIPFTLPRHRFSEIAHALASYGEKNPDGMPPYGIGFLSR